MDSYLIAIRQALVLFPVLALFFTVPYVGYNLSLIHIWMFSTPYPSGPSRSSPQDGAGRQGG